MIKSLLDTAIAAALAAGDAIERMRRDNATTADIANKADGSPVTRADRTAHGLIATALANATPDLPLLSEESQAAPYAERREWRQFWMIDPLDGTKEFIRGSDEFTVNIALIDDGAPILGVVYAPAQGLLYYGAQGLGAYVRQRGEQRSIAVQDYVAAPMQIAASRSHRDPATEALIQAIPDAQCVAIGSSLKLCKVADGGAHLYPRLAPTMEWDIAAGHALVAAAGGAVVTPAGAVLQYNKPDLHIPSFVAGGKQTLRELGYSAQ